MADDIEDEAAGTPAPPDGNAGPADAGGGAAPGGGGGPMIAALARQQQGPQTSAPGLGDNAGAMGKLQQCVQLIQQAALGLQPGTPLHKDALQAAQRLSRHLPQGAPTAGVQLTGMRDLMRQIMQSSFLPQIMQQLSQRGQGGGQGASAGPAPNLAPNPSMPLPGA